MLHVEYELAPSMRDSLVALLDDLAEWEKLKDSGNTRNRPVS